MDANGQRFWMLADAAHWRLEGPDALEYNPSRRVLRLPGRANRLGFVELSPEAARERAESRLTLVPGARDAYGTWAFWSPDYRAVLATGAGEGDVPVLALDHAPTDLAWGFDGVLYVAVDGAIVMQDRRDRWPDARLEAAGFDVWRFSPHPHGGVWALDREGRRLLRLRGTPAVPQAAPVSSMAERFEPAGAPRNAPAFVPVETETWPAAQRAVAIATSPGGRLAVLTWDEAGAAHVHLFDAAGRPAGRVALQSVRYPYSIAWLSETRFAVMAPEMPSAAPAYDVAEGLSADAASLALEPVGEFYPLVAHGGEPFMHGPDLPPRYLTTDARRLAPLHALSRPRYVTYGEATNLNTRYFDSGAAGTVWHRIYLEAAIPDNCGVKVYVAAADDPPAETASPSVWHEHHFGRSTKWDVAPRVPRGTWLSYPSEVPFHAGLLPCGPEPERAGLFTALVQRTGHAVSQVRGRYLQVRLVLTGDGRSTPEVAAVRVYGPRFSYIDNYLPELYQETLTGADADAAGDRTTPHDFLERFLGIFEATLTPLEDRIASAHLLTDARTAPVDVLDWLGSWIGVSFDRAYPSERRRRLIQTAPELYRRRGTLEGLRLALDLATQGACTRGEIVVVEDFRLRRTFSTILGADLADENDPLLAGLVRSGNSIVGDTLFLGDEARRELLALYGIDAVQDAADAKAVAAFLAELAFQVTILVHRDTPAETFGLVQRIVELETPAHVLCRVVRAGVPLLSGVASLLGIDTYLEDRPAPEPVRLNASHLGVADVILRPPSLDPRLEGALSPTTAVVPFQPPVADAGPSMQVGFAESFMLDGSGSRPGSGGDIALYTWTLLDR